MGSLTSLLFAIAGDPVSLETERLLLLGICFFQEGRECLGLAVFMGEKGG